MSNGGIKEFLSALFQSEGGGDYQVVNKYGYVGKYQFGESALSDLGYYVSDGTSPIIKLPHGHSKFQYQWKGTWTGKDGIHSLDDFRNSPDEQDVAAVSWVRLLCSRAHKQGADQYEGKVIAGITITHSGIVGAAHLKGFGTAKHPGVMKFLESNGAEDPADANGTTVSHYIGKFADYDLGCCSGTLGVQFVNKKKEPIAGVHYQVKSGGKVLQEGHSDAHGKISQPVRNVPFTQTLEVWVKEVETNLEKAWTGAVSGSFSSLTLTSPHSKIEARTNAHPGSPGDHRRNSKLGAYTVKQGDSLWKIAHQHGTSVAEIRRVNPGLDGNLITPGQQIKLPSGGGASSAGTSSASASSAGASSAGASSASASSAGASSAGASSASASSAGASSASASSAGASSAGASSAGASSPDASSAGASPTSAPSMDASSTGASPTSTPSTTASSPATPPAAASSADQPDSAPAASQAPTQAKVTRNDNGHPVAVAPATSSSPPEGDPKQKMFEIFLRDAKYGRRNANFSGPVAAHKAKLGQPIYSVAKAPGLSTMECWKYVKIALLASGMVDSYPTQVEAKDAGIDLERAGFKNILSDPAYHIASPYDAPEGAVIVYGTTDKSTHGHAEVLLPGALFASDYVSPNSRVMRKDEKPTLIGKGRKVIGVWIK
ncbi:SpoIVD-associated factor A [Burkholderia lata]|uniref:SpoIVD-associated factor A n=1 Tax=Burkholderia lata (strain ATCC 17760 / DSM 23089 / LMG 22485 / NCIMB 9086 / R18194 / 383) TaxID=482957 RepID=A0A6P2RGJ6_BURL3|nr:LysM domain-containing protein [Burkholderia lata]VWC32230.1 SpoIVD-associated factor A [Burkholderia lata]